MNKFNFQAVSKAYESLSVESTRDMPRSTSASKFCSASSDPAAGSADSSLLGRFELRPNKSPSVLLKLRIRLRRVLPVPSAAVSDAAPSTNICTAASVSELLLCGCRLPPALDGIPGSLFRRFRGLRFLMSTPLLNESATMADRGEESVDVKGPGIKSCIE